MIQLTYNGVDITSKVSISRCWHDMYAANQSDILQIRLNDADVLWDKWAPAVGDEIQVDFDAISTAKRENYERIYHSPAVCRVFDEAVRPMMEALYLRLYDDLIAGREESPIFRHHIAYVNAAHYERAIPYEKTEPNQLVVDYIASMTDDYFVELYANLFGDDRYAAEYRNYSF